MKYRLFKGDRFMVLPNKKVVSNQSTHWTIYSRINKSKPIVVEILEDWQGNNCNQIFIDTRWHNYGSIGSFRCRYDCAVILIASYDPNLIFIKVELNDVDQMFDWVNI